MLFEWFVYLSSHFTFDVNMLHASPLSSYLFSISALSASQIIISPYLALPFPARHTIFGVTPFCQPTSQWHHLKPLPLQRPLLSDTKLIYLPTITLIFFTNNPVWRKEGKQKCQPASQTTRQPPSQPNAAPFVSCKAHLLEAVLDAIS